MRLLFMGDIVGVPGAEAVRRNIDGLIKKYNIDFVAANGENMNPYNGITPTEAEDLHYLGVDVITLGNHAFRQRKLADFLDDNEYIIRPANFPSSASGNGYSILECCRGRVCFINLMGQVGMDPCENPFSAADKIISKVKDECDFIFVDFHAEATSEKKAMGYYLDGRVDGVFGTHTHIETADEQILPKGTAYITDVGMTGVQDSVLGAKPECSIRRFVTGMNTNFEHIDGVGVICGIVVDTEKKTIIRIKE